MIEHPFSHLKVERQPAVVFTHTDEAGDTEHLVLCHDGWVYEVTPAVAAYVWQRKTLWDHGQARNGLSAVGEEGTLTGYLESLEPSSPTDNVVRGFTPEFIR